LWFDPDTGIVRLNGTSTGSTANRAFIEFYESDDTTRQGFVGYASTGNADLYVRNDISDIRLETNGGWIKASLDQGTTQYDVRARHLGTLAYINSNQTITTAGWHTIVFNNEHYDRIAGHNNTTNPTRMTVPTGVSFVRLSGWVQFSTNSTGRRLLQILKNGTAVWSGYVRLDQRACSSGPTGMYIQTPIVAVSAGNYFELEAYQDSGGSLTLLGTNDGSWFQMEVIESDYL
jgi:hypothetical protein